MVFLMYSNTYNDLKVQVNIVAEDESFSEDKDNIELLWFYTVKLKVTIIWCIIL